MNINIGIPFTYHQNEAQFQLKEHYSHGYKPKLGFISSE